MAILLLCAIHYRRGGRVVDCGGLENRCTFGYRGFESLSLRIKKLIISNLLD